MNPQTPRASRDAWATVAAVTKAGEPLLVQLEGEILELCLISIMKASSTAIYKEFQSIQADSLRNCCAVESDRLETSDAGAHAAHSHPSPNPELENGA